MNTALQALRPFLGSCKPGVPCRRLDDSSKGSNGLECLITYTEQHLTSSLFTRDEHFSPEFLLPLPQNVGLLAKFFIKDRKFFLSSPISRMVSTLLKGHLLR